LNAGSRGTTRARKIRANLTKVPHVSGSTSDTMNFDVSINDKLTYKARLVYANLTDVRLYLSNTTTGAQVYDSGLMNKDTVGDHHD